MNVVSGVQANVIGLLLSGDCKVRLRLVESTSTITPQSSRGFAERAQLSVHKASRTVTAVIPIFVQKVLIIVSRIVSIQWRPLPSLFQTMGTKAVRLAM